MTVKTKTLWNGYASISTILIDRCKKKKESMRIEHKDSVMVIPLERLDSPDWVHKKTFRDKYKDRKYKLYNFKFKGDENLNQVSIL